MPLLQVDDLSIQFLTQRGILHAVNGISYELREREVLVIIGESGSGKSVHAQAILGLLPKDTVVRGDVRFGGRSLLQLSENELSEIRGKDIGFVPQNPMSSLNPVLTIGHQVEDILARHTSLSRTSRRARVLEMLHLVGIKEPARVRDQFPHELSGGMRQRVVLATAVCCEPKILIADEPTTALDVTVQARILDLVLQLRKELGLAVLWITHDLGVTALIAQTVQVMYAGRVLERGPVRAIFKDPRNAYTYGLLRSTPDPRLRGRRLPQMKGNLPDPLHVVAGDPFAPRNPFATEHCFVEMPPLLPVAGELDHLVAAWYDLPSALASAQGQEWLR